MSDRPEGQRILVTCAALVIVIAGLRASAPLLLPLFSAAFLAVLCIPPMRKLQRHGLPTWLAITLVVFGATVVVLLVTAVIGRSISEFQSELPDYRDRLNALIIDFSAWTQERGVGISSDKLLDAIDSAAILELASDTAVGLLAAVSNLALVILVMVFILLEAHDLPHKIRHAAGDPEANLDEYGRASESIYRYLAIKTLVSLATGALAAGLCAALGIDFPLLWGLIAFLFNYVPNVGSILAAIPAVLLAALLHGPAVALIAASGYTAINVVLGNIIEPRLMGRRLGLSPLVVLLSLVFWGWVWGPVGMLLSVPLTVIVKILLEHSDDLRWIAVLLGSSSEHST